MPLCGMTERVKKACLSGSPGRQALRHALGGTHFCPHTRVRNSFPLISPWGQNLAQNRALGFIASHTLCAKFSCMCPARMHMSSGRDYF